MVAVYADDFISLAMATSKYQLGHVINSVMTRVHDVFPKDNNDEKYSLSLRKLKKDKAMWDVVKDVLGFMFDGKEKKQLARGRKT